MKLKVFCLILLMCYSLPTMAGDVLLYPLVGGVNWSNNSYNIQNISYDYENVYDPAWGFKVLWRHHSGFAVGGGFYFYTKDIDESTGNPGHSSIYIAHGSVAKYFNVSGTFQPFIGIGVGRARASVHGDVNARMHGPYFEFLLGADYKFNRIIAFHLEYRRFKLDVDSVNNEQLETYGNAFFAMVAVYI